MLYSGYQSLEDYKMRRAIRNEARRLRDEWANAPIITSSAGKFRNHIVVIKPFLYTIYDENVAEFIHADIREKVMEEFERQKKSYLEIVGEI